MKLADVLAQNVLNAAKAWARSFNRGVASADADRRLLLAVAALEEEQPSAKGLALRSQRKKEARAVLRTAHAYAARLSKMIDALEKLLSGLESQ